MEPLVLAATPAHRLASFARWFVTFRGHGMTTPFTLKFAVDSHCQLSKLRQVLLALFSVFAAFAATVAPLTAQTIKGIVARVVRDKTGAVVPGAQVTATGQARASALQQVGVRE